MITKETRQKVLQKFNGHCAYCGKKVEKLQVDHIFPKNRVHWLENEVVRKRQNLDFTDINDIKNLFPACGRCNRYKSDFLLEEFRSQINKQVERARKNSWNFVCAEDFGFIKIIDKPVIFYYEQLREV